MRYDDNDIERDGDVLGNFCEGDYVIIDKGNISERFGIIIDFFDDDSGELPALATLQTETGIEQISIYRLSK